MGAPQRSAELLEPFVEKMNQANVPHSTILQFIEHFSALQSGHTGHIREADLSPVGELPRLVDLNPTTIPDADLYRKVVVIKLNGGLGTSMGMTHAKSLLTIKENYNFLDIITRQILHQRKTLNIELPLLLLNSKRTRQDSLDAIKQYDQLPVEGLPIEIVQPEIPKVMAEDLSPAKWPIDAQHEWCPPGHGNLFASMWHIGTLQNLLNQGFRYAFVSNADNLGAVLDPQILAHIIDTKATFLMEVAKRTPAMKKGGHLARLSNGQLILREVAQCAEADLPDFQNTKKHGYFNTNNIWVDLKALAELLDASGGLLSLPLIRNQKTLNPNDPSTPPVYHLECAMGAAIERFPDAVALEVPGRRFAPVKTCNDLLVVRSNAYMIDENWCLVPSNERVGQVLTVDMDKRYFKTVQQLESRFPDGPPSLKNCTNLTIQGDMQFPGPPIFEGQAKFEAED